MKGGGGGKVIHLPGRFSVMYKEYVKNIVV